MLLTLTDVHVSIGLSHILQGVSLTVAPGEVVGLFARNGVGKTTIVKTIAGWHKPTSGRIIFDGRDIQQLEPEQICRSGVGIVPEDRRIFPGLSVLQNLELGLMQVSTNQRSIAKNNLEAVLKRFPRLKERESQLGTTLSGGEQQMLSIARVLVGLPKLMVIDEPTEGLAPMIVEDIFKLIEELRERGIAILLIEQNVRRAFAVCDRFYALERGQIVLEESTSSPSALDSLMKAVSV